MNKIIYILATSLIVIGLTTTIVRSVKFDLPFYASTEDNYLKVQMKLSLLEAEKSNEVSILLPSSKTGAKILEESFNTQQQAIAVIESQGKRKLVWGFKNKNFPLHLDYSAILQAGVYDLKVPKSLEQNLPKRLYVKVSDSKQVKKFLSKVEENTLDPKKLIKKVAKCLNLQDCAHDDFLSKYKTSEKLHISLFAGLLRKLGFEVLIAKGFNLKSKLSADFSYWLRVKIGNTWKNIYLNKLDGSKQMPSELVFWSYQEENVQLNQKKKNVKEEYEIVSANERKYLDVLSQYPQDSSFWTITSLRNVPISVQSSYRMMLLIPIGCLVIVLFRNFIGLATFGTFMPVLIAIALLDIGLMWGMGMLFILTIAGLLVRLSLSKLRLLLIPRLATILSVVILLILAIAQVGYAYAYVPVLSITLYPIVIVTMVIERMSIMMEELGFVKAFSILLNTLIASLLSYLIISIETIQYLSFTFPELLLIVLSLIILIGNYRGFRLVELYRFKLFAKNVS